MSHCLKSATTRLALTQRENHERTKKHRKRLAKLQSDTDTVVKELRADVVVQSRSLYDEVSKSLSSPMAKFRICSAWKEGEIPEVSQGIRSTNHWNWVKQRIDDAFYNRVFDEIESWAEESNKVTLVEEKIVEKIEEKLGILQDEIMSSENAIKNARDSDSDSSRSSSRSRRVSMKRISVRAPLVDMPNKMPPKLNHRINNAFSGFGRSKSRGKFEKDPVQWTQKRAEKLMSRLLRNKKAHSSDKGDLECLMDELMYRPYNIIDMLEEKIPVIIEANMELMRTLEEINLHQCKNASMYETMFEEIEALKKALNVYGDGYVFVNDFKLTEVRVVTETLESGQSMSKTFRISSLIDSRTESANPEALIPQGLWSCVHPGMLKKGKTEKPIAIRLYTASSGIANTFQEVAKLRCVSRA